jgi:hypothetical protein
MERDGERNREREKERKREREKERERHTHRASERASARAREREPNSIKDKSMELLEAIVCTHTKKASKCIHLVTRTRHPHLLFLSLIRRYQGSMKPLLRLYEASTAP